MEELTGVFDDLMALVHVVEAGGFSAASHRYDIPVSRLSRRVTALEKRLGVALLVRNARRFSITEEGRRMFEHGLKMRTETRCALATARESLSEPSGNLRVACPMALAATVVAPLVIEFARKYPQVVVTLASTDGRASAFSDAFDLAIQPSSQALRDSSLVARKLVDAPYALLAAPALCQRLPTPAGPAELHGIPAIGWTFNTQPAHWRLTHAQHGSAEVHVDVRLTSDNLLLIRDAAVAGIGVAQLPPGLCQAALADGRLCIVAPGWLPPPVTMFALYPSRRALTLAGRCFLDMLVEALHQGRPAQA